MKPGVVRKAMNAGVTAGLTALSVIITGGGSVAITDLTSAQWTAIGFGALYAGWSTYAIPNDGGAVDDSPGEHIVSPELRAVRL